MRLLNAMMKRVVKNGSLTIIDPHGVSHVHGAGEPSATIRLHDPKLPLAIALNPELVVGEAYMDGRLTIENGTIRDFLKVFAANRRALRTQPSQKLLRKTLKRIKRYHQHNPVVRARQNVAHHYDLSNELYRKFLDESLNYSCAYYQRPDMTLEEAQQAKMRHIAAKLNLKPGQRVLDIGCGWGAMSLFLAEHCDVETVGVTLSSAQFGVAKERAKAQGLENKASFRLQDYRDVSDSFDRIVSIGMFEHVGITDYQEFFRKIFDVLTDDGVALVHSISRKGIPGTTGAWVRKYIFPGGYSPALSETLASVERAGLWVTDIEILRLHYAETLLEWETRFQANRAEIEDLLDEKFARMWEFYLIMSEFTFRHGKHMNFQMQLTKDIRALPLTRDYMREAEIKLGG